MTWAKKTLSGWGRNPRIDALCARPERLSALHEALAQRQGQPVLAHGLGRSYGDAALIRDGRAILTRRLNRMLDFDPQTGWLRCEGGVSLEEIIAAFVPQGFFPPVVPGTQHVTVAGALACDIHGKNHHVDGCFSDHVRRVELLTGLGEVVLCDRDQHPELFWATVGGMGLTGLIISLELRLTPIPGAAIELETIRVESLDEFFEVSARSDEFTHVVSWVDTVKTGAAMGRGVFMRGRHAPASAQPQAGPMDRLTALVGELVDGRALESNLWLNRATIRLFNEAFFRKEPPGATQRVVPLIPFFFPLDAVPHWNHLYGQRGFFQYQLVVPSQDAARAILDEVSRSGQSSFLSVIKEFGDRDHGGLSFPQRGITLAMDFPNTGEPLMRLFDRLDALVLEAQGRLYLGKDARLARDDFRRMYPDWERWRQVRDAWDPQGVFQSALGHRLGLCHGAMSDDEARRARRLS